MTNKPKEQNHEMYCDKDFCKYGDPSCPVIVRNATNKPPPREFWISLGEDCDDIVWRCHPKNEHYNFHVIEKSAYDTLQAELDESRAEIDRLNNYTVKGYEEMFNELRQENKQLQSRIERAESLLRKINKGTYKYYEQSDNSITYFEAINKYFAEAKRE